MDLTTIICTLGYGSLPAHFVDDKHIPWVNMSIDGETKVLKKWQSLKKARLQLGMFRTHASDNTKACIHVYYLQNLSSIAT